MIVPEAATIVTVADAFDAMTHDRPYRAAQPVDEAIKEIVKHSGKQFNPAVVDALQRLVADGVTLHSDAEPPQEEAA